MTPSRIRTGLTALVALAALVIPQAIVAQDMDHDRDMDHDMDMEMAMPGLDGARTQYEAVRNFIMTAAENTPEEMYDYRPTEEVRSLGELYGHVAGAQYLFCGTALGEAASPPMDFEQGTKEQIVSGMRDAFAFCDRAYAELGHDRLHEEVTLFGSMNGPVIWVLIFNATHNWEHYGNMVTYLRMNGLVPPSSGGMQGGM